MMKKICLLVLIMMLGKFSYSQYPIQQYLGADSAIVTSKGGLQGRLINWVYVDTAQANTQRIKNYPGAQIVTNGSGLRLWLRNLTATAWLQIPAGSATGNIYTIDGTLTGNRVLTGGGNPLTFTGLSNFNVSTTDSVRLSNSQQYFVLSDTVAKLVRSGDATVLVNSSNGSARLLLNPAGPVDEKKYEIKALNEEFWIAQIKDNETIGDTIFFVGNNNRVGIKTSSPRTGIELKDNTYVDGQLAVGDTINNAGTYAIQGATFSPSIFSRKAANTLQSSDPRTIAVLGQTIARGSVANRIMAGAFYAMSDSANAQNISQMRALQGWVNHNGTGTVANAWGNYQVVTNNTTGTITNAYGSVSGVENRLGTTNKLHGQSVEVWNNNGGSIDTAFGQVVSIYNNNAASTIGAVYGLSIGKGMITNTGGTHYWRNYGTIGTSYGLYLDTSIDVGLTKYALYSFSRSNSYVRGSLGLGTTTPDSLLTVAEGAHFLRGIRASGLPQTPGTKALRIDANGTISYTDTLIDAGGTVTSVATNNSTGITGGTITTTGTLAIDTLLISTRAWRQKGIDSVAALANSKINGTLLSGYLTKATGTNTIGNSQIYDNGSNVGIGTTTPTNVGGFKTLSINGNAGSIVDLQVNGTSYYQIYATSDRFGIDNLVGGGGGVYMSSTNGYIGLGQLGPDSLLTVNGGTHLKRGVRMSGLPTAPGTKALRINAAGTISIADTLIDAGGTVTSVATNNGTGITGGTITTTGTLAIDTALISTRAWRQKGIDSVTSLINTRISGTTNYIPKFTSSSAIGNSVIQESSGNIGIGVSPSQLLTIGGRATPQLSITSSTTTGASEIYFGDADAVYRGYIGYQHNGDYMQFSTAGSERMRLDASGNLGINTSSPQNDAGYKALTINGTSGGQLGFQVGGTLTHNIYGDASRLALVSISSLPITFSTNSTERMRLDASGNLNLGQSTSALQSGGTGLTIYGSSASEIKFLNSSTGSAATDGTALVTSSLDFNINNREAGSLIFGTSNAERMRITSGGNVGIGTTTPAAKLDVNGSIIIPDGSFLRAGYSNGAALIGRSSLGVIAVGSGEAGDYLVFNSGGSERMRITSGGNVGIGTTSPQTKLAVSNAGALGLEIDPTAASGTINNITSYDRTALAYKPIRFYAEDYRFVTSSTEAMRLTSTGELLINTTTDAGDYKLQVNGNTYTNGSLTTAAPSGGTAAAWKLGSKVTALVSLVTTDYIQVEIGGVVYKLALVN